MKINRRDFLKISGRGGGGLILSLAVPVHGKIGGLIEDIGQIEFNNFISIDHNGEITIMLTKHEMGQGTGTAIPTIIADELNADWSKVKIKQVAYDPKYTWLEMGTTGGSGSISRTWDSIRIAGATVKKLLMQTAANNWGVDIKVLEVENSYITNLVTNERVEFGALAEGASQLPIPKDIVLKTPKEYTYIVKTLKNRLTEDVISGKAKYGIDMNIPGMVYASIEKCPIYKGTLKSYDAKEAKKKKGVLDVFPIVLPKVIKSKLNSVLSHVDEGVVVIAMSTWIAFEARKLLKIEWEGGENESRSMASLDKDMEYVKELPDVMSVDIGNVETELANSSSRVVEMQYDNPYQAHAVMEPLNATAHFENDSCELWVGTQDAEQTIREVATSLELPMEKITLNNLISGGSFGRRYHTDTSIEAAFISKHIKKPVKLVWTREDEVRNDHFQPYLRNYLKAIVSREGEVIGIENRAISTVEYASWSEKWEFFYAFPNIRCYRTRVPTLLHEGAWRAVGEHLAAMSKECFVDELAHELGKDPLDYRVELLSREVDLGNPKDLPEAVQRYVLPRRDLAWQRQLDIIFYIKKSKLWSNQTQKGKGRGFAIHAFGSTICAQIAEVSIGGDLGYCVDKVTAIVHCGLVINPHFAKGQIEGSIIWALSALKYGGMEVENGMVQRSNFHDNKVLRIDELPEIDVIFLKSDERPSGLGEPGTPPLAPAVLNAIFNASGKRVRKIPVTKKDLL
ncbi:MAG: molybdopterin cofactor-binding domain-containing protein [Bacteroidota bacterium]